MAGLISASEAAGVRSALSVFRVHTATVTSRMATTEDAHGDEGPVPGAPRMGVACKYRADDRVRVDENGTLILRAPTLTLAYDDPITDGDTVSDIQDSEGRVLAAGPFRIRPAVYSAGLGPSLEKRFVLRSAEASY